jgi:curved DNA-binding protein
MKYKDYYQALGVERTAQLADIKKAYRKLAHQYHPDISKDPKGEEKFKEVAEAYATLKDSEKRKEYDSLGSRPTGDNFAPPPQWQSQYGAGASSFDDVDLTDIFSAFRGASGGGDNARRRASSAIPGDDYVVNVAVSLEDIYAGRETDVKVEMPEFDSNGLPHRVSKTFRVTVPKEAVDDQRLRLPAKGGPGRNGGKPGDLYVVLKITPHPLYELSGRNLSLDLPLAPWEAVLGTTIEVPTLAGTVELSIKPGTLSNQKLRLAKRGLAGPAGLIGDLYAVVRIVVPDTATISESDRTLYRQLATESTFSPRQHFRKESK